MNIIRKFRIATSAIIILLATTPIYADIIWPALYLQMKMVSWLVILCGLVIEYPLVRYLTKFSIGKSIIVDLSMNIASALLGVLLIPIAGIAWEFFPGSIMYKLFNIGTFNPITWTATFLFAVFITTIIEMRVIVKVFKSQIGRSGFWWLILVNAISVGIAFLFLIAGV